MKKNYDWIRLKYDVTPNIMLCERCKKQFEMPDKPIPINMYIGIMKLFAADHKRCKDGSV